MKKIRLPQLRKIKIKKQTVAINNLDQETFDLIKRIANEHSTNVFGYLEKEDLKNEIWVICLEVLPSFCASQGRLEHFLRTSVKNRLVNRFKEVTKSVRSPCGRCPFFDAGNTKHDCTRFDKAGLEKLPTDNRLQCDKWKSYCFSVQSRNSLLNAIESQKEQTVNNIQLDQLIQEEMIEVLMKNLEPQMRNDLQQLLSGKIIPKIRLDALRVQAILILSQFEE